MCLGLASCGGGSTPIASQETATELTTPASVSAITTLNLSTLANYAAPVLPAYYDDTVLALDNTPDTNVITNKVATLGWVSRASGGKGGGEPQQPRGKLPKHPSRQRY